MKKQFLTIFLTVAIVAFGITAFAGQDMGYGPGKGQGPGPGDGQAYDRGSCYMNNLSDDEIKKANEEREAFFKATEGLRQDIYAKELELKSELAKKDTDTEKAIKIQNEISELKSQFGQKRLDHMLKMKKINPSLVRGFGGHRRGGQRGNMMDKPCIGKMN
ncbi:MAG: periplasmic heavy metal sensor [Desulfobacterium sp.]|nr:periplasmic heavy metal sensor [Desulfobacterium sp.]MBU3947256.1 periplasmic heavy metal sensor [Pseudomonadota bacterium]MBU4034840.1 periplasmic heavy metal sensor [Pseudomonadota bacterium]